MNYNQTLRAAIQAAFKTPADPKISGVVLQAKMLSVIDAIDSGGIFMGDAVPSTNPQTEANCFYLASTAGNYTNFLGTNGNPISLSDGEVAFLASYTTQESADIRWRKKIIIGSSNPHNYVSYGEPQELSPAQRSQALGNIGGASTEGEYPGIVAGDIVPKSTALLNANNEFAIQTTGGDVDIKSGGSLLKVIRGNLNSKLEPFLADTFVSTDMDLVDPEQTLSIGGRTAYYFPIAKGVWGSYGTTQENNGYIVVGDTPYAVYYSNVRPTVSDYGMELTPVSSNSKNYYTTPGDGWLVVIMNSGSDTPAVHVAWSNSHDDEPGTFNNTTKDIAPLVQWIHPWGMSGLFGQNSASFDEIDFVSKICYRRNDRVALNSLDWTMTTEIINDTESERAEYVYVFSASIASMKSGGLFRCVLPDISVSGNTLTYKSSSITTIPDFVVFLGSSIFYYELATVATRTFAQIGSNLTDENMSNDMGLTYFLYNGEIAITPAFVVEAFAQSGKDPLFNAVTYQKILAEVLAVVLCQVNERLVNLENRKDLVCENLTVNRRASIFGWNEVETAPASADASGNKGDYYIDTDHIYICVADNTWKRAELSTFAN